MEKKKVSYFGMWLELNSLLWTITKGRKSVEILLKIVNPARKTEII